MRQTNSFDHLNRLTSIQARAGASTINSYSYQLNSANQRTALTNADSSYWLYQNDVLGQVISGRKYWPDHLPVAGQQFSYSFDDIGNRITAASGGNQTGDNLRTNGYTVNDLNQYYQRTVPGYVAMLGSANSNAQVTLWRSDGSHAQSFRKGEYYMAELPVSHGTDPLWLTLTNLAVLNDGSNPDVMVATVGNEFLPGTPETFGYDFDGNLTSDGRWNYTWDAENRLVSIAPRTSVGPRISLKFEYDWQGRRIRKRVWATADWTGSPTNDLRFVYDGWNLVAELDALNASTLLRSYVWGLDLSGTAQGAGGVGGLLFIGNWQSPVTYYAPAFDGNGNVMALVSMADATVAAQYEYGPFGEVIRSTGPMAKANPFRFSTKYQDDETDLVYYTHRYYNANTGRWLSRDPLTDQSPLLEGLDEDEDEDKVSSEPESAPMRFVNNNPISSYDGLGLWPSSNPFFARVVGLSCPLTHQNAIHRAIPGISFNDEQWLDVATVFVDLDQSTEFAFKHAMRAPKQDPSVARQKANDFIRGQIDMAETYLCHECSDPFARVDALLEFGQALHTVQDWTSPAHHGFKVWHGLGLNPINYARALAHVKRERFDPGEGSQLDQATTWLWSFFVCKDSAPPMPADFFSQWGADHRNESPF